MILTAVVEAAELEQVTVTELHALADNVTEGWDFGNNGGLGAIAEGGLAVVHHGAVVIGDAQGAGCGVIVAFEVVFFTCKTRENKTLLTPVDSTTVYTVLWHCVGL